MHPKDRRGHAGAETQGACRSCDRSEHRPYERRIALLANPRMEVIGDHRRPEPDFLGSGGVLHERAWIVLLGREPVSDLHGSELLELIPTSKPDQAPVRG